MGSKKPKEEDKLPIFPSRAKEELSSESDSGSEAAKAVKRKARAKESAFQAFKENNKQEKSSPASKKETNKKETAKPKSKKNQAEDSTEKKAKKEVLAESSDDEESSEDEELTPNSPEKKLREKFNTLISEIDVKSDKKINSKAEVEVQRLETEIEEKLMRVKIPL